jgi:hypothetical protein
MQGKRRQSVHDTESKMFVDTVSAITKIPLDVDLDVQAFRGSALSTDFETGELHARLFRNSRSQSEPRVTFWPQTRTLRVEFSVPKVVELAPHENVSAVHTDRALTLIDAFLRKTFTVELPPVRMWRCQRIDYAVNFEVGDLLPQYMSVLRQLQVSSLARHPFADSGVVWKSRSTRGRWIKFYDKTLESGARAGTLRFEVSNFRDAVRYMAQRWFGCERTVGELVAPGRAAYVLSYFWLRLGLGAGQYGQQESELCALRLAFGSRSLAGASHALHCIRTHGTDSYKSQQLISKSSYYRWLRLLRAYGFLTANSHSLPTLNLPLNEVFELVTAQNLETSRAAPIMWASQKKRAKNWAKLAQMLDLNPKTRPNGYLLERFYAWRSEQTDLDGASRAVPRGGEQSPILRVGASALA